MTEPSHDLSRVMLQVVFIGGLIVGCFWILQPFLLAIVWAIMIVVATWPILLIAQAFFRGRRGPAVTTMIVLLLLLLLVPLSFAIVAIAQNADEIIGFAKSLSSISVPPPPSWLDRLPVFGPMLFAQWGQMAGGAAAAQISAHLSPYAKTMAGWLVAQAGNAGLVVLQSLVTLIIAAVLYGDGESAAESAIRFARQVAGAEGENVLLLAAQAIRAVALGIVISALVQAVIGGIALEVTGVPFAVILASVIFVLGVAQVGPSLILVPAVIWLYWEHQPLWGTVLLACTILLLIIDHFLRPLLIKRGVGLSLMLVFAGVIGGLYAFGAVGLFIGPVLLAVGHTLLMDWIAEGEKPAPPPSM